MVATQGALPYDIANLLGGAVRILYAIPGTGTVPSGSAPVPEDLSDIIDLVYPYAPKAGWHDFGATKENFTYSRGFETEGLEIQQFQGNIIEEITAISRNMQVSAAEFSPEVIRIIENATGIDTVAASAGVSAQKVVKIGSFASPARYRMAFIARRYIASGSVIEPVSSGRTRGRFVGAWLNQTQVSADDTEIEIGKGELAATGVTFAGFPEPGVDGEEAFGGWAFEDAGTITAT